MLPDVLGRGEKRSSVPLFPPLAPHVSNLPNFGEWTDLTSMRAQCVDRTTVRSELATKEYTIVNGLLWLATECVLIGTIGIYNTAM